MENKLTYEQFRRANPVCEHPVTGKFGWKRVNGELIADEAKFDTEDEAADDRAEFFSENRDKLPG